MMKIDISYWKFIALTPGEYRFTDIEEHILHWFNFGQYASTALEVIPELVPPTTNISPPKDTHPNSALAVGIDFT